jgi:hypothetical protein
MDRFYRRLPRRAGAEGAFAVGGHATTAGSLSTPVALIALTAISSGFALVTESTAICMAAPGWSLVVHTPPEPRT